MIDLNNDGYKEVVVKSHEGMTFTLHIFSTKTLKILNVPLDLTEYVFIKDINHDKIYEIISYDSSYDMIFGFCMACSPAVKYVAHYDDDKLLLQPDLMKVQEKNLYPVQFKLSVIGTLEIYDKDGNLEKYAPTIEAILTYFYKGETKKALMLVKKYIKFKSPSMKVLFFKDLIPSMKHSYFWKQIKKLNGWEQYQDFEIPHELFYQLEKL